MECCDQAAAGKAFNEVSACVVLIVDALWYSYHRVALVYGEGSVKEGCPPGEKH